MGITADLPGPLLRREYQNGILVVYYDATQRTSPMDSLNTFSSDMAVNVFFAVDPAAAQALVVMDTPSSCDPHSWQFSKDGGTKIRVCGVCKLRQKRGRKRWNTVPPKEVTP